MDAPLTIAATAATAAPLLLAAFGALPASLFESPRSHARTGAFAAALAAAFALVAALPAFAGTPVALRGPDLGGLGFGILLDRLSAVVFVLVAFLLAVVTRYAVTYLGGNPRQGTFTRWLALTGAAVLVLVASDNLAQFFAAWVATSLALHQLLTFNADRPGALLAARKKFVVSRLGDLCLLAALVLVWHAFGTWRFEPLFAAARTLAAAGPDALQPIHHAIAALLVAGALLKSAQFPFHSWLPDTMETPTPVSALMHAGIINAGGFLILRLNPVVSLSTPAMTALALVGAFTAVFASLVLLTQSSVKRALAFSTVAQMGFMMLECGVGAFGLALLHIVAHSLYKAHAFLSSGTVVGRIDWTTWRARESALHPLALVLALVVAVLATTIGVAATGLHLAGHPPAQLSAGIWLTSLAYLLARAWARRPDVAAFALGTVAALAGSGLFFALHKAALRWLAPVAPDLSTTGAAANGAVPALLLLFVAGLVVQAFLPHWSRSRPWRALGVHARNGFYLNTLANRAVARLRFPA